jgi:hypothetical protein
MSGTSRPSHVASVLYHPGPRRTFTHSMTYLSFDTWFAKASLVTALVATATLGAQTTGLQSKRGKRTIALSRWSSSGTTLAPRLVWIAAGGVDLPSLDRATQEALTRSQTDAEAANAIRRFIAGFHDGHLAAAAPGPQPTTPEPPTVGARATRAHSLRGVWLRACHSCRLLSPVRVTRGLHARVGRFGRRLSSGHHHAGRAADRHRSHPRFRPAEFPSVCERVWQSLRARGDGRRAVRSMRSPVRNGCALLPSVLEISRAGRFRACRHRWQRRWKRSR